MEDKITKDGFILYSSHWAAMSLFTDEEMGMLMKSIFKYYLYNTIPEFKDKSLMLMFNVIKPTIDKDMAKYVQKCKQNQLYRDQRKTKRTDNEDIEKMSTPYLTDKDKEIDKDKEKEIDKEEVNNNDGIDNIMSFKSFIKQFGTIRGKSFRATNKLSMSITKGSMKVIPHSTCSTH